MKIRKLSDLARGLPKAIGMKVLVALESLAMDITHAVRALRRKPGTTAVIVVSLALGIGVNAAIFAVADAVLLRPLSYPESDRLVVLSEQMSHPIDRECPSPRVRTLLPTGPNSKVLKR